MISFLHLFKAVGLLGIGSKSSSIFIIRGLSSVVVGQNHLYLTISLLHLHNYHHEAVGLYGKGIGSKWSSMSRIRGLSSVVVGLNHLCLTISLLHFLSIMRQSNNYIPMIIKYPLYQT